MDPISDMLIRIKNAQRAEHETVLIPYSRLKHEIARVLEKAGLLGKIEKRGRKIKKFLEVFLYSKDSPKIVNGVKIISRPSRRLYIGYKELPKYKSGSGVLIISTSKGIMSGKEAYKAKLGGQLIAEIW